MPAAFVFAALAVGLLAAACGGEEEPAGYDRPWGHACL